jgi:preprotein translocase subunit SecY
MGADIFFPLLVLIAVIIVISLAIKRFFQWFPIPILPALLSPSNTHSIKELLLFLVSNKETRIRLCITLGVLIIIKILAFIPAPGINHEAFATLFQGVDGNAQINGSFTRFSIVSLGIMPFFAACILTQLLSVVIPYLKRVMFGDEEGRRQIVRYTCLLTVGLALVQSYGISVWLENTMSPQGMSIVAMQGVLFRIVTMVTLTATTLLFLLLADIINKYGIGNGIAMIIISAVLMGLFASVHKYLNLYVDGQIGLFGMLLIIVILIISLYLAFFFTSREKKIELIEKKTKREITIPLKLSWVAKGPVLLSSVILSLPWVMARFVSHPWLQSIAQGILLFFCTYIYASIIFKPAYIQNLLQRFNLSFKAPEGKKVAHYLDSQLSKILIITFLLILILPNMPRWLHSLFVIPRINHVAVSAHFVYVADALSILVFVGVFFDILSQLEFFYQKSKVSNKSMIVAYIAFDEIEAKIKSEYLNGKGVNALVEPLRFTWGIPIRTAIDQYRIYTPAKDVKKARKLLE